MVIILDGKKLSEKIGEDIRKKVKGNIKLVIILVGNDSASEIYVKKKMKKCLSLGIHSELIHFKYNATEDQIITKIEELNLKKEINGIMIQLPLPKHLNSRRILDHISINKDVDGLNSYNLMKILLNEEKIVPATPKGIFRLLEEYNISVESKNVAIIGFSDIVGKPLATMCLNRGATTTVCHIKTKNLSQHTLGSDIIMTSTGCPNLIKENMVKKGAIVVDIGISRKGSKVVGDVDYENVKNKCSYITPVPGGVGPMTIISLVENLISLSSKDKKNKFTNIV